VTRLRARSRTPCVTCPPTALARPAPAVERLASSALRIARVVVRPASGSSRRALGSIGVDSPWQSSQPLAAATTARAPGARSCCGFDRSAGTTRAIAVRLRPSTWASDLRSPRSGRSPLVSSAHADTTASRPGPCLARADSSPPSRSDRARARTRRRASVTTYSFADREHRHTSLAIRGIRCGRSGRACSLASRDTSQLRN
jgi:hypothetical protein